MSDVPRILPPNASSAEFATEQATARIGSVPTPTRDLWNPDTCPVNLLPWLAWTYSVDRWNKDWSEAVKRQAIRDSIEIHRRKGTVASLKRAIEALGYSISFVEWWQSEGSDLDPHEFRAEVDTSGLGLTLEQSRIVFQIIDSTKPLRSHMADISFAELVPPADAYVGAVPFDGAYSYHVAEVGALPLPGIPDGSLALVGEAAPYSIWQYEEATEEWFALLVYVDAVVDLPVDSRHGALALVGTSANIDEREIYVYVEDAWLLAGTPRVVSVALLASLPAADSVKVGTIAVVGSTPEQEIHRGTGTDWLAHLVYRSAVASLPVTARAGALALVGTDVNLDNREVYVFTGSSWLLAGSPRVVAEALLASLPAANTVKSGTVGVVGSVPEQELHTSSGLAWIASLLYRASSGALPATARDGALALVGTGTPRRTRDAYLFEDAAWHKLGMSAPRTLSSLFDVQATDAEGAVARYGNQFVRLARNVTNPFGSAINIWLPLEVYAATTRTVVGRLVGTEAVVAQSTTGGFAFVSNGVGSVPDPTQAVVSQAGDYIQLFSTGSSGVTAYARCNFAVSAATRFYFQAEIAWDITGTGVSVLRAGEGNSLPHAFFTSRTGSLAAAQFSTAANSAPLGIADALRAGGQLLRTPASGLYSTVELLDEGRAEITRAIVDGLDYAMMQRDATTGGVLGNGAGLSVNEVGFTLQTRTAFSAGTATIRVRRCTLLTYA